MPPAPSLLPLQPLWELPAPVFSSPQPLLPEQAGNTAAEPAMSPAVHRAAKSFFNSLFSIRLLLYLGIKNQTGPFAWDGRTVLWDHSQPPHRGLPTRLCCDVFQGTRADQTKSIMFFYIFKTFPLKNSISFPPVHGRVMCIPLFLSRRKGWG